MDQDTRDMLLDTAGRFFAERCGKDIVNGVEKGVWPVDFWTEIEEMGLPLVAVPEDKGGVGGSLADMMAVLRLVGENAVPVQSQHRQRTSDRQGRSRALRRRR